MSDNFSKRDDGVLDEFEQIMKEFETPARMDDVKIDDLSKTMVVPRVEDLIEERPLQPAADAESLFAAVPAEERVRGRRAVKAEAKGKHETKEKKPKEPKLPKEKKVKKAATKKNGKKKSKLGRILLTILLICVGLGLCACIAAGIYVKNALKDAPKIDPDNIYDLLSENSVIVDCDGNFLDNVYQGDGLRTNLEYNEIPRQLIDSFVCIEDKTFWDHHGFNFVRIVGAIRDKVTGRKDRIGGTSTITQQLARNVYLADIKSDRDMKRKIIEAYYTVQIEKKLSKEQIVEAYLNTIYLGYNCYGVDAAAQAYFSKDVQDLTLMECAQLASLPQSPNTYAPLKRASIESVDDIEALDVLERDEEWITYYNDAGADRVKLVLRFLHEQGKIDDETYETAKADSIRDYLNPGTSATTSTTTSYFTDYVKGEVLDDLIAAGYDEQMASNLLYNGGLIINSTMDKRVQDIMDREYDNPDNFPGVNVSGQKDAQGNILDNDRKKILLYSKEKFFNENGDFVLQPDEFEWLVNGDLKIYGGKRMNFYKTSVGGNVDYSAEFKNLYEVTEGKVFYSYAGGTISIPSEYKNRTDAGDLVISSEYFEKTPKAFTKNEDGSITVSRDYFTLKQKVRQPQSAMVIMDYRQGNILGMIGGRDIKGKLLYNRATAPRQPGSSIKPLAIYSVALQMGYEGYIGFTAAMPLDDLPTIYAGNFWPKNWYVGYTGATNLRHAVEQSINACAVNLYQKIADPQRSILQLQKMGVTTVVPSGDVNDANASALALGGMTRGISPLEMTAAYGTFGNYGVYTEPICYTTVTTKRGDVVLEKTAAHTDVLDESVASLMTDILRTTVTNGLGSKAKLKSQPSAGKTGTTSERYDIWFCGLTPQYSAAAWIGSDVNIPVSSDSSYAAKLWAKVMDQVGELVPRGEFVMKGEFETATVNKHTGTYSSFSSGDDLISEIFIKGTVPGEGSAEDIGYKAVTVCAESGYLATPWCPAATKMGIVRPGGVSWEKILADYVSWHSWCNYTPDSIPDAKYDVPEFYCPYHNLDPAAYPISPFAYSTVHENLDIDDPTDEDDIDPDDILDPDIIELDENGNPIVPVTPDKPDKPGKPEDELVDPELVDPEIVDDENTTPEDEGGE